MGSYSALGPAIGTFLGLDVPQDWLQAKDSELVAARMESQGLTTPQDRGAFQGAFTDGSTMGNRISIHAALQQNPGAYVYLPAESQYSVFKTLRVCDSMTNRWSEGACPRFHEIPCEESGAILADRLV
ncbi:hypothetical protein SCUP515_05880 [Seiridium cupressi]